MKTLLFAAIAILAICTSYAEEKSALTFLKVGKTYRVTYANSETGGSGRVIHSRKPSEIVTILETGGAQWFLVKYRAAASPEESQAWINFAVIEKVREMEAPPK